ncbi:putative Tfp assembly type protein (PilE-like) [Alkalihalophilus pseudofirmus OF4]|uniref:Tfp assembly type protein (PilE-like) n=2 Tax=Alkalihalophilus pseudofirmus TaxID=79885 RepID=D3FWA7_ALKPO|nr:putative Tfp assembly type protein (PilE-like) [Alkalihalophilus pseudofirmus OF4]
MKKWLKQTKNEKGLTLVELLAVVVILGIIAAIAVPSISGIIENSKKDAAISNAQQVLSAARLYAASGGDTDDDFNFTESTESSTEEERTGIAEYHEPITNPWGEADSGVEYTISFTGTVPAIIIEFPDGKCDIGNDGAQTATDLSQKGRDACNE